MTECARILVVDDDADLLRITSYLLRGAGYEVLGAGTGSDGIRLVREKKPDLVLLDYMLPDIDGLEVCRRLKADADLAGSYVVLLSAFHTAPDDQAIGLETGADGYIARPIENRELLARVEAMLRLKRTEDALRERTRQLDQRVKELNCLYGISQLVQSPGISLEEILQGVVALIPPAWQHPEITCARIILEEQEFKTGDFEETTWRQACDIKVRENPAGRVEVYYLEERPELDEGPFQEQERKLLCAIAERLGRVIERMRAQAALHESEATARALLNAPTDVVALIDTQGFILDANETMARRFDRPLNKLIGLCAWDLLPPQSVENRKAYIDQVIQSGKPIRFEDERGGIWNDNVIYPIVDAGGQVTKVAILARDITERVRMEEALRESEERFRSIFEQSQDGIALTDEEGLIIEWNQAMEGITGMKAEEVLGKPVWDVQFQVAAAEQKTQEWYQQLKGTILHALESGQAPWLGQLSEYEYQHPDGTRRFMQWVSFRIRTDYGFMLGSIARDTTERTQMEQAIWASEQRYRNLFEQTLIGIISSGRDGCISAANPAALDLLGYRDQEELVGLPADTTWFDPEYRLKVIQVVKEFGYHPVMEVRLKRKDGKPVHVLATSLLDRDKDGEFLGITGMFTDITDRKQVEDKLQWELGVDVALSALYEPLISSLSSIEEIANTVLDQVRKLTGSAHGYVSAIDPVTGDNIGYTLTEMLKGNCVVSGEARRIAFPRGSDGRYPGLWGHALNTGEAFYTNSPQTHPAYQSVPEGHIPIHQFLSVPVMLGQNLVGQIATANPSRDYTERDLEAIQRVGEFYALAIQRKRVQAALQESEEKYRDLVEKTSDVIYTVDKDGMITYINPAIEAFLGYSPSEVVGRPFAQFIAPEDLGHIKNNFEQVASGTSVGPNEYRSLTKSGEVRWMRTSSQPILEGDQVTGVRGVLTDITDRKRAEQQLEETAAAAERERLARELHDAVTQALFSASLIADTLPRVWEHRPEEGQRGLEELSRLTHGALAEMRTMLVELRPGALSEQDLGVLLRQLTDGLMARTRMRVATTVVGDCSLPADVQIALYRIAQEALNNVAKHAQANRATVSLDNEPDCVTLRISDDGRGFDLGSVQAHQLGMQIMHERAQAIGASFEATSQPGQGTEIVVTWTGEGGTKDG